MSWFQSRKKLEADLAHARGLAQFYKQELALTSKRLRDSEEMCSKLFDANASKGRIIFRYVEAFKWLRDRMSVYQHEDQTGYQLDEDERGPRIKGWGIADAVAHSYADAIDDLLDGKTWNEALHSPLDDEEEAV